MRMKIGFIVFMALALFIFVRSLPAPAQEMHQVMAKVAKELANDIRHAKLHRVAISDILDDRDRITVLGRFLGSNLATDLFQALNTNSTAMEPRYANAAKRIEIIERERLSAIMEELKLTPLMLQDPQHARELGRVAGVDGLIIGNVTEVGEFIVVNLRVITTTSGKVVSARRAVLVANSSLKKMLKEILYIGRTKAGNNDGSETEGQGEYVDTGEGVKTPYFITKPLGAVFQNGVLAISMSIKNYTDNNVYVAFLGDYYGNYIVSNIVTSGGAVCNVKKASPFPFYKDDFFGGYYANLHTNRSRNFSKYASKIKSSTETSITIIAKCSGNVGNKVISADIGLHLGEERCVSKESRKCTIVVTKTSASVRNIPIKKTGASE